MGNRGCLHNEAKTVMHRSKRDAWVTCMLDFKNRKRSLMSPGQYTELFFLDEATALAAGHRPCAECRRARYSEFLYAWGAANCPGETVKASDMDARLKRERTAESRVQVADLKGLPDGVMVMQIESGVSYVIYLGRARAWSFEGYGAPTPLDALCGPYIVLTPSSTVSALKHGYRPELHPTAL